MRGDVVPSTDIVDRDFGRRPVARNPQPGGGGGGGGGADPKAAR